MAFESLGPKHPLVADARRLARRRRARVDQGRFLVEGAVLLGEALDADVPVQAVLWDLSEPLSAGDEELAARAAASGARLGEVTPVVLARVTDTATPQPVVAIVTRPTTSLDDVLGPRDAAGQSDAAAGAPAGGPSEADALPLVVLAGVADPGNAGTLLRSAEAAGCRGVICCGGVDPFAPKTVRASAGSVFHVPVVDGVELRYVLARLGDAGITRVGLSAHGGAALESSSLTGPIALVLGSEAHGLPGGLDRALDELVTIATTGRAESLNVAMAGTLAVFEAARQRRRR